MLYAASLLIRACALMFNARSPVQSASGPRVNVSPVSSVVARGVSTFGDTHVRTGCNRAAW
jgi:hypothetical protein